MPAHVSRSLIHYLTTGFSAGRRAKDRRGAARVLKHWVRAKLTHGMTFGEACDRRGWSRPTTCRRRDEARAAIAIGLTMNGIEPGHP